MRSPIYHSDLTKRLMDLQGASPMPLTDRLRDLVIYSSGGVVPEGGYMSQVIPNSEFKPPVQGTDGASIGNSALRPESSFQFGKSSEAELVGVIPILVKCVRLALTYTSQDFCVYDGIRSLKEQKHYVDIGTSQTMQSKHLPQPDGFGHAVDLVPWIGAGPKWDWGAIYPIAHAMDLAATQLGVEHHVRWGGAWDRTLADFGGDEHLYFVECQAYQTRHPGKDFIDGPHFEWLP